MTDAELRQRVVVTEAYWRAQLYNYDLVVRASGILAAVTTRPDGTRPDPALAELLYRAEDPAKTAYDHALVRLSQRGRIPCVVCGHQGVPSRLSLTSLRRAVWLTGLVAAGGVFLVVWSIVNG